jgi:hypothetical protein
VPQAAQPEVCTTGILEIFNQVFEALQVVAMGALRRLQVPSHCRARDRLPGTLVTGGTSYCQLRKIADSAGTG